MKTTILLKRLVVVNIFVASAFFIGGDKGNGIINADDIGRDGNGLVDGQERDGFVDDHRGGNGLYEDGKEGGNG